MIVGIFENRNGVRYVVIRKENNRYKLEFPIDVDGDIPFERLDQLKAALDDVIWSKGKAVPISEE